jgi:hypothetical protein
MMIESGDSFEAKVRPIAMASVKTSKNRLVTRKGTKGYGVPSLDKIEPGSAHASAPASTSRCPT